MSRGSTPERRSPCTSTRSIAADGGASGSHNTPPFTRVVLVRRGRPFFFARQRAQARGNTTQEEDRPMTTATMATGTRTAESELRAAARRRGLTMKELAARMGVGASYLSRLANGGSPWTPKMREKAAAVLGEVPGQGIVYRQGGVVTGESSFIRERAREMGMTMRDLADRAGVSYGYMSGVARGRVNMGVKVQTRIESALKAPAKIASAQCANRPASVVNGQSSYVRERAPRPGHDHAGACRAGRRVRQLHVGGVPRPQGHGREGPGAGRGGAGGRGDGRVSAACLRRHEGRVGPHGRSRLQPERGRTARRHQLLPPLPDHERQVLSVGGRPEEAARRAVPAREVGGARHARPR